jgi:flagellar M-ring protein FliF
MQSQFSAVVSQFRALGGLRLLVLAAAGLATLALVGFLAMRVTEPPMALLYGDLETRDAAQVVAELERTRIPYRLSRGGTEIHVPDDQVARVRLSLAREGLPAGGSIGYELFDRQNGLTTTPFQQDVNRVRALEGELARTLRGLAGVTAARVHVVLPRRDAFARDRGEAQASVVLQMRGGRRLDPPGVQAIVHLVAAAVPGLRPQNISIVDGRGELLARGGRALGPEAADGAAAIGVHEDARRAQELRLARGLEDLLERALGPGRVRAEASIEFDHSRLRTVEERFDPDNQVPRSQQSTTETNRSGEPRNVSVANQLPGAPPGDAGGGPRSEDARQEETTNFEIGRTTRTIVREQPAIRRISVAVLVDGVVEPAATPGGSPTWRERTPDELARIAALVRSATGFDEARGDRVEVVSLRFSSALPEAGDGASDGWLSVLLANPLLYRLLEFALLAVLALAALLVVLRPLTRRLLVMLEAQPRLAPPPMARAGVSALSGPVAVPVAATAGSGEREVEDLVKLNMVEGMIRASTLRKVGELADRNADETLAVVRRWLAEGAEPQ